MCKNYIEIKDGKVKDTQGIFKKGHYIVCLECGHIMQYEKSYGEKNIANICKECPSDK